MQLSPRSIIVGVVISLVAGFAVKTIFFPDPIIQKKVADDTGKTRQQLIDEGAVTAENVELVQGRKGTLEWKLLAKTAKYNQGKRLVGVIEPRLTAYYGRDRREVFVSADRGEVDQASDNLTLYDNVKGSFGSLDISAPFMDYVGSEDKVLVTGGVHVQKPELQFTADEAEIDLESRELVATGRVKAVLNSVGLEKAPKE